jgi:hypothetical protein
MGVEPQDGDGLRTGGLEGAGGLHQMPDKVARSYGNDIVGKRGPIQAAKAVHEMVENSVAMFAQGLSFSCGSGVQVVGNGSGQFSIKTRNETVTQAARVNQRKVLFPWDIVDVRTDSEDPPAFSLYRPLIRLDRADLGNAVTVTIDGGDFEPVVNSWLIAEISAIPVTEVTIKLITNAALEALPDYPSCYEFDAGPTFPFLKARIPLWRFYDANTTSYEGGRVEISVDSTTVYGEKLVPDGPLQVVYTLAEVPGESVIRAVPDLI